MRALTVSPVAAGLSSQKLALVGLASECLQQGRPMVLPDLVDLRPAEAAQSEVPFDTVFCRDSLGAAADRLGLKIVPAGSGEECLAPLEALRLGVRHMARARAHDPERPGYVLLGAMRPNAAIASVVERVTEHLAAQEVGVGVQLRVENQWLSRVVGWQKRMDGAVEQIPITAGQILAKVAASLGRGPRTIFAICDETDLAVPRAAIRAEAARRFGFELIFKGDVPESGLDGATGLTLAMVDFEAALTLPVVVGQTRSRFFNVAAATGFARHGEKAPRFMVGNAAEDWLVPRTDNGSQADIAEATFEAVPLRRLAEEDGMAAVGAFFARQGNGASAPWGTALSPGKDDSLLLAALEEVYGDRAMPVTSGLNYQEEIRRRIGSGGVRTYLETGVFAGTTLALAGGLDLAIGVDPAPRIPEDGFVEAPFLLVRETSDDFFRRTFLAGDPGFRLDLTFIDGLHIFEYALRDFIGCEALASPRCEVLVHDVLPRRRAEAARQRFTRDWTGDVWRLPMILRHFRPDLTVRLVPAEPTGLAVVSGLDPGNRVLMERYDEVVTYGLGLSVGDFLRDRDAHVAAV